MNKKITALTLGLLTLSATAFANPAQSEQPKDEGTVVSQKENTVISQKGLSDELNVINSGFVSNFLQPKIGIGYEVRYFSPKMKGSIKTNSIQTATGSDVNFHNDLGFDDKDKPSDMIFSYKNMSLEWMHLHNKANSTKSVTFNNHSYAAGAETKNNFDMVKFDVKNKLVGFGDKFNLDWDYGIGMYRFNASVDGSGVKESKTVVAPIPHVGIKATANVVDKLDYYAGINGLPLGGYGNVFDFETGLRYTPAKNLVVDAGYRILNMSVHKDDKSADYRLSGPFVGIQYLF